MASTFNDLIAYFENIARRHVDIRHTDNEKHFFRMEIDEVLAGINRTDVKHPYFILESYDFDYNDNRSDNLLKKRNGAFVLLGHVDDATDNDAIQEVRNRMEAIGDEIMIKIKADKRNPLIKAVRDINLDEVKGVLISNEIDNNHGLRFTFSISSPLSTDVNPDKWLPEGSI